MQVSAPLASQRDSDRIELYGNWVFMGDSLTEGVGASRISYVTELTRLIRQQVKEGKLPAELRANLIRLRPVDAPSHSRFVVFNLAGFVDRDKNDSDSTIWLWNLACEGKMIDSDKQLIGFLETISPSVIVIFRGGLESIIRPTTFFDNNWPWWVPVSWRGYAAMDPRCYFSATWWRKLKQQALDSVKQKVRLQLLTTRGARPMIEADKVINIYQELLGGIKRFKARTIMVGMLPVNETSFPESNIQFQLLNDELRALAEQEEVEFLDWGVEVRRQMVKENLYYRDGFHPNAAGARFLAQEIFAHLFNQAT
jgi:lysophospholipase L1-like esterase